MSASFSFDPAVSRLGYRVSVRGVPQANVQAVVLLRRDDRGRARVIQRLSGPATLSASGNETLGPLDRDALVGGRLILSLVTTDQPPLEAAISVAR